MFVLAIVLSIYWLATFIAFRGVEAFATVSKWGGIVGTIIPAVVLIVLGFAYLLGGGNSQIDLAWKDVIPDFTNFNNVVLAAGIFLFYAGMEMNAIHVKDVTNPTRNYPIAILIARSAPSRSSCSGLWRSPLSFRTRQSTSPRACWSPISTCSNGRT